MRLTICIGFDSREPLTWAVLAHSILRRTSQPVRIVPINLTALGGIYTRTDPAGTTEFSLSRFLTPYVCDYEGWGLFMDSDMLCRVDICAVLEGLADRTPRPIVSVCPHDYTPRTDVAKATGAQTSYPRKNWSSFMLFDNAACRMLTPAFVNAAPPATLHRLAWCPEDRIGALALDWNWLVGEYAPNPDAKVLHYTLGAPCFRGFERGDHADLWWDEYRAMLAPLTAYVMPEAEQYVHASGARP